MNTNFGVCYNLSLYICISKVMDGRQYFMGSQSSRLAGQASNRNLIAAKTLMAR
jgi:hypothetical protein